MFRLGEFDVLRRVGHGATADVWRGAHRRLGLPVAVKILRIDSAWSAARAPMFNTEVRAVAALEHASIARLFDYGAIGDHEAHAADSASVKPGSPYMVMEYASGGTLAGLRYPLPWPELRTVALQLLDALAHAHARGVVHRDLKPANVLICSADNLRPGLKLTDFGIAQALDDPDRGELLDRNITGSPGYMAPEQFRGQWRDYGPWTDLYALGCLFFELATGRLPFDGLKVGELSMAHQSAPVPALGSPSGAPEGVEGWLMHLLAKHPTDRFRCAADATAEFLSLDRTTPLTLPKVGADSGATLKLQTLRTMAAATHWGPSAPGTLGSSGGPGADATAQVPGQTMVELPSHAQGADDWHARVDALERNERRGIGSPSPMPATWQSAAAPHSASLVGAGLRLVGLRDAPFVGRESERDIIWSQLAAVAERGQTRVAIIRGPAGAGKSRLAEWVSEHAVEVGAARSVRTTHSPEGGRDTGLARLVAQELGCVGLETAGLERRLRALSALGQLESPYETAALATLIGTEREPGKLRLNAAEERLALVLRIIGRAASDRPAVVWLDDVQWGGETLSLVEFALDAAAAKATPALYLLTVRDESLLDGSVEAETLARIAARDECETLNLAPLSDGEQVRIVEGLVGLDRALAARIADRTAGNPLFAVQLLGDWIARGVLTAGESGFVLVGPEPALPDDLHAVWMSHVDRGVGHLGDNVGVALEIAAALGQEIRTDEWGDACQRCGTEAPDELLDALLTTRLATTTDAGWTFGHGMLRESLERRAREAGRWASHNKTCAAMVEARVKMGTLGRAGRLARHYSAAGFQAAALALFWEAADELESVSDFIGAHAQLMRATEALDALGRADSDRDRAFNRARRARLYGSQREYERASALAHAVATIAAKNGWHDVLAIAAEQLGSVARHRANFSDARAQLARARQAYETTRDRLGVARTLRLLGWVSILQGDRDQARALVADALRLFEAESDALGIAWCLRSFGDLARLDDDLDAAEDYFASARDAFEDAGHTSGVSECVHGIAEVLRLRGRLDEAAVLYRRSISLDRSVGARDPVIPTLNLGLCELARRDFAAARHHFESALREFERAGQGGYAGVARACLLPAVAGLGDFVAFDQHLELGSAAISGAAFVDPDIAAVAEDAAATLLAAGQTVRAAAAAALAAEQLRALGQLARADRLLAAHSSP